MSPTSPSARTTVLSSSLDGSDELCNIPIPSKVEVLKLRRTINISHEYDQMLNEVESRGAQRADDLSASTRRAILPYAVLDVVIRNQDDLLLLPYIDEAIQYTNISAQRIELQYIRDRMNLLNRFLVASGDELL